MIRIYCVCLAVFCCLTLDSVAAEAAADPGVLDKAWAAWYGISPEAYAAQKNMDKTISDILTKVMDTERNFPPDKAKNEIKDYIQGKFTEAEPLYQRSLAITEKTYGPTHLAVASVLDNMVELYGNMGKGEQAEKLAKRAEKIREKGQ